jgi:hypothetical protein
VGMSYARAVLGLPRPNRDPLGRQLDTERRGARLYRREDIDVTSLETTGEYSGRAVRCILSEPGCDARVLALACPRGPRGKGRRSANRSSVLHR